MEPSPINVGGSAGVGASSNEGDSTKLAVQVAADEVIRVDGEERILGLDGEIAD